METVVKWLAAVALLTTGIGTAWAEESPWGKAQPAEGSYEPQKVVYDVNTRDVATFEGVLDRASYLSKLYEADPFESSIVLVLHGDEIHFFARRNFAQYEALMRRAQSLTVGTTIEFRMCQIAARGRGYEPSDVHGFVQMVPMADSEIVRLQNEHGYAYMQ